MVQQYNVGLHPSPRRRVEEVGEEPRVEEGILGAQMGMVEYHVIVGGGGWYTRLRMGCRATTVVDVDVDVVAFLHPVGIHAMQYPRGDAIMFIFIFIFTLVFTFIFIFTFIFTSSHVTGPRFVTT